MDRQQLISMVNTLYPMAGIAWDSKGNLEVVRYNNSQNRDGYREVVEGNKHSVTEFSLQSRKNLMRRVKCFDGEFGTFCSLTYPKEYELDGKQVKKDLNKVLGVLRYEYGRGINYVWWLEFQERGAPHVHLAYDRPFDALVSGKIWSSWSKNFAKRFGQDNLDKANHVYGLGRVVEPVHKVDGVGRYLAAYITKDRQKIVPENYRDVGRFWGTNRDFPIRERHTLYLQKWELIQLLVTADSETDWTWVRNIDILPAMIYDTPVDFSVIRRGDFSCGGNLYCEVDFSDRHIVGHSSGVGSTSGNQFNFFGSVDDLSD